MSLAMIAGSVTLFVIPIANVSARAVASSSVMLERQIDRPSWLIVTLIFTVSLAMVDCRG